MYLFFFLTPIPQNGDGFSVWQRANTVRSWIPSLHCTDSPQIINWFLEDICLLKRFFRLYKWKYLCIRAENKHKYSKNKGWQVQEAVLKNLGRQKICSAVLHIWSVGILSPISNGVCYKHFFCLYTGCPLPNVSPNVCQTHKSLILFNITLPLVFAPEEEWGKAQQSLKKQCLQKWIFNLEEDVHTPLHVRFLCSWWREGKGRISFLSPVFIFIVCNISKGSFPDCLEKLTKQKCFFFISRIKWMKK